MARRRRRVGIGNNKGGTGKTTATVNLAAALAEEGLRVLVVDMDPQANATRRLGLRYDPDRPIVTTSEVISSAGEGVAAEAIVSCGWPEPYRDRISLIPARFDLENRVSEAGVLGAHQRLATAMHGADDDFDITLIDFAPSLGHLTQLGLAASDAVVCTLEPEYDAVEGALRFRDFVGQYGRHLNPEGLAVIGYYVGGVRSRVGEHEFQLAGLPDTFGADVVWEPHIPERAAVKDAASSALPLRLLGTTPAREIADRFSDLGKLLVAGLAA